MKLCGLFGSGRSGTTWLGSIINSHPDVAYRFEPLHKLMGVPRIDAARRLLKSDELDDARLAEVYAALIIAHPLVEKPPYFAKHHLRVPLHNWASPLGRSSVLGTWLFERLYTPTRQPTLVFKQVTMEPVLEAMLTRTNARAVYLVRHPCGVVASALAGQRSGMMPVGRLTVLDSLLRKHDAALAARTPPVDSLSDLQKNALLWRIEVEQGVRACEASPNGQLVIYEALCRDPIGISRQVFDHLGLSFPDATLKFVESSVAGAGGASRSEPFIRSYFSVFRDPQESMNKWKTQLAPHEIRSILDMVEDSEVFAKLGSQADWTGD
jgi:hypothetical protein